MPNSPRPSVALRSCALLAALALGLSACKPGRARLPETTSSAGVVMITVPSGSFTMGAVPASERISPDSAAVPPHMVTVSSFQIARTEVTVGLYKKYLAAIGREGLRQQQDTDFLKYNSFGDEAPVVNLSPANVREFIEWLNGVDGGGYRLPTEAEWEYACRAGGNDAFCGGDKVDELGWYSGNSKNMTHPVAQKKPNAFGLYDMSGNAEEWVQDCWQGSYNDAPTDGSAWESSERECKFRVVRGGSWLYAVGASRTTRRDSRSIWPYFHHPETGIRLARTR